MFFCDRLAWLAILCLLILDSDLIGKMPQINLHYFFYVVSLLLSKYPFCMQGVLGIKVKIMLDWDPKGKVGPKTPLPDLVTITNPKEEEEHYRVPAVATDIEVLPVE